MPVAKLWHYLFLPEQLRKSRLEACLRIRSKEDTLISFKLNQFQKRLVQTVMDSLEQRGQAFFCDFERSAIGNFHGVPRANALESAAFPWSAMRCDGARGGFGAPMHVGDAGDVGKFAPCARLR
jgi:hypothetical protein